MKTYACDDCGHQEEYEDEEGVPICPSCENEMYEIV
jgi:Zn finger protein HypA/HybF involved in hydrogenase expression